MLAISANKSKLIRISKLIGTFLLGQGTLQLIQIITGFMLFRWLSIEEYGQYSMAFAFQTMAYVLVEFGFSGTIVALVGSRIHEKKVIGGYIKAGDRRLCAGVERKHDDQPCQSPVAAGSLYANRSDDNQRAFYKSGYCAFNDSG